MKIFDLESGWGVVWAVIGLIVWCALMAYLFTGGF